jgi:hypothetical protein
MIAENFDRDRNTSDLQAADIEGLLLIPPDWPVNCGPRDASPHDTRTFASGD